MTEKERELALYCLKASSDYHSEVCEECINYPNCDHTIQDDVTETIIKALEQERSRSAEITQYRHDCEKLMEENERLKKALEQESKAEKVIKMRDATPKEIESIDKYIKSISKPTVVDFMNLDQVPKIEWIPVGERLPENHDDVLVWFEYIKDDWDCAWWGLAYYSPRYKKWVVSTNERNPIVKAWIPLPEPYEEEKE